MGPIHLDPAATTAGPTTQLCVVGPHVLLVEAVTALLERSAGFRARSDGPAGAPDLVLLVCPRPRDAAGLLSEAKRTHPGNGIVCLVVDCTPADAVELLRAGAAGCVSARLTADELAAALRQAARGEITLSSDLAKDVIAHLAGAGERRGVRLGELSAREEEILRLVCEGLANKEIAQRLYLSVRTVENHLARVYSKLGVRTRTEAAVAALTVGAGHELTVESRREETHGSVHLGGSPLSALSGRPLVASDGRDVCKGEQGTDDHGSGPEGSRRPAGHDRRPARGLDALRPGLLAARGRNA